MSKISHLKRNFLKFVSEKTVEFFPAGPFFLMLYVNVYQSALIRTKVPRPKKFLITRLV